MITEVTEHSQPLENPQHEKFAQLVAKGTENCIAYGRVFRNAGKDSCNSAGARLFGRVRERIKWLQAQSATAAVLSARERRERLARMVRADLENFDPAKDGDLLQEKTITTSGDTVTVKYKLPGKRECIMDDAKLAGELPDAGATNVQVNVGLPQITINAPPSFFKDRGQ